MLPELKRKSRSKRFCSGRKRRNVVRMFCVFLAVCLLITSLSGCLFYRPLRFSQLQEFEQNVHKDYPGLLIRCRYVNIAGVYIDVFGPDFDEECAYRILGYLQPVVSDEEFIQDLFDLFEKERDEHNWKLGWRPVIYLCLSVGKKNRYQFSTRATKEGYNSGRDPDSYTWDGYTTWYGTEFLNQVPKEISPEEIEEAVKRYSLD